MFKSGSLLLLLLLFCSPAAGKEPERVFEGVVVELSDGDTIYVQESSGARTKVRLYGIDAPEIEKISRRTGRIKREAQAYGEEAHRALTAKIGGKRVRLEVLHADKKTVTATVWLNNLNVNVEMVMDGFAWAQRRHIDRQPPPEYLQAEDHARRERHGLWKQGHPQPPWEFKEVQKMKFESMQFWMF